MDTLRTQRKYGLVEHYMGRKGNKALLLVFCRLKFCDAFPARGHKSNNTHLVALPVQISPSSPGSLALA
jgi:hypothetical protein